jgi:hypothetical protein
LDLRQRGASPVESMDRARVPTLHWITALRTEREALLRAREPTMDDVKMDALLSMMQIEELEEALDLILEWGGDGDLTEAEAEVWQQRINAWVAAREATQQARLGRKPA